MGTAGSDAQSDKPRKAAIGAPSAWIEETLDTVSGGKNAKAVLPEDLAGPDDQAASQGTTKAHSVWSQQVNREGKGDRLYRVGKGDRLDADEMPDPLTKEAGAGDAIGDLIEQIEKENRTPLQDGPELRGGFPAHSGDNVTIIPKTTDGGGVSVVERVQRPGGDNLQPHRPAKRVDNPPDFRFNADGSAKYTVQSGDGLARIARMAYKEAYPTENVDQLPYKKIEEMAQKIVDANKEVYPDISLSTVKSGWNLKIPSELIYRKAATERVTLKETPGHPDYQAIANAGASKEFMSEVLKAWDSQPAELRRRLHAAGLDLVVVGDTRDYDPVFALERPHGYPPGTTFMHIDGIHTDVAAGNAGKIAIMERSLDTSGRFVSQNRARYAVIHESAHALDATLGHYTRSDAFKPVYEQDIAKLSAADRSKYAYYIQGYDPAATSNTPNGRKELFADIVSSIFDTSPRDTADERAELRQKFPNAYNTILDKLVAEKIIDDATRRKLRVVPPVPTPAKVSPPQAP